MNKDETQSVTLAMCAQLLEDRAVQGQFGPPVQQGLFSSSVLASTLP